MKALLVMAILLMAQADASTFEEFSVSEESITRGCLEPGKHNLMRTPTFFKSLKEQNKVEILEVSQKVLLLKKANEDIEVFHNTSTGYSLLLNEYQSMTVTDSSDAGFELELIENPRCRKYLRFFKL